MTFPIGTCPSCGGKRIWIDRGFNPYPKWAYIHKRGCIKSKRGKWAKEIEMEEAIQQTNRTLSEPYPEEQQKKEAAEFGACPVHGLELALECRTCIDLADRDSWGEDLSYWEMS